MTNFFIKFDSFGMMENYVISPVFKQHKIFDSIVIRDSIYMMNNFFRIKIPPEMFFHDKAVFKNISKTIDKRVFFNFSINISLMMFWSTMLIGNGFFPKISLFCFCFGRWMISLWKASFFSTINWMALLKTLYSFWHIIFLQIKRAAFGGLSETVKFLHLLTAQVLDKINPFLISVTSLSYYNQNINIKRRVLIC